jgi:hypothetical protein
MVAEGRAVNGAADLPVASPSAGTAVFDHDRRRGRPRSMCYATTNGTTESGA